MLDQALQNDPDQRLAPVLGGRQHGFIPVRLADLCGLAADPLGDDGQQAHQICVGMFLVEAPDELAEADQPRAQCRCCLIEELPLRRHRFRTAPRQDVGHDVGRHVGATVSALHVWLNHVHVEADLHISQHGLDARDGIRVAQFADMEVRLVRDEVSALGVRDDALQHLLRCGLGPLERQLQQKVIVHGLPTAVDHKPLKDAQLLHHAPHDVAKMRVVRDQRGRRKQVPVDERDNAVLHLDRRAVGLLLLLLV
mmetsp:Transcript_126185/g.365202  ORF Transcript_126185/g.365202 Transcript_126185/m.365202 type:complete len:253 (-) Transcript_126185:1357-2115(-)